MPEIPSNDALDRWLRAANYLAATEVYPRDTGPGSGNADRGASRWRPGHRAGLVQADRPPDEGTRPGATAVSTIAGQQVNVPPFASPAHWSGELPVTRPVATVMVAPLFRL